MDPDIWVKLGEETVAAFVLGILVAWGLFYVTRRIPFIQKVIFPADDTLNALEAEIQSNTARGDTQAGLIAVALAIRAAATVWAVVYLIGLVAHLIAPLL